MDTGVLGGEEGRTRQPAHHLRPEGVESKERRQQVQARQVGRPHTDDEEPGVEVCHEDRFTIVVPQLVPQPPSTEMGAQPSERQAVHLCGDAVRIEQRPGMECQDEQGNRGDITPAGDQHNMVCRRCDNIDKNVLGCAGAACSSTEVAHVVGIESQDGTRQVRYQCRRWNSWDIIWIYPREPSARLPRRTTTWTS